MQKARIGSQIRFGIPDETFVDIPLGVYAVMWDEDRTEFYLEEKPPFNTPEVQVFKSGLLSVTYCV